MHHSYVIKGIDASKMREDASRRLRDRRHPEETVVHYHQVGEHCTEECEQYRFTDLEIG